MEIEFYNNGLTGDVGPVIEVLPRNLERLGLGVNELAGTIPPSISNLSFLKHFMIRSNNLEGTIPSELGLLDQL